MRLIRLLLASAIPVVVALLLTGCSPRVSPQAQPQTQPPPLPSVAVRTLDFGNGADRPLPTYVYHSPGNTARQPLVVFSHGYTCLPSDYDDMLKAWAIAGFVVAAPVYPTTARGSAKLEITDLAKQPADVSALITAILADGSLSSRIEAAKIAVAGHSLGGMTSVGLISSYARDKRVSAAIVMAGSARTVGTDYPDTDASMFFVHGNADTVVRAEDGRAAYTPFSGKKAFLTLPDGDHRGPYFGTDAKDSATVIKATTDYLLWSLRGDAQALKRLDSTMDIDNKLS